MCGKAECRVLHRQKTQAQWRRKECLEILKRLATTLVMCQTSRMSTRNQAVRYALSLPVSSHSIVFPDLRESRRSISAPISLSPCSYLESCP
jgi:hypothetical protein